MRNKTSAALFALTTFVLAPSLGLTQFRPQWQVGDWWVVKTCRTLQNGEAEWSDKRFAVTGIEKVHNQECFVIETQHQTEEGTSSDSKFIYYVRTDNWLVVMQVYISPYLGILRTDTLDRPLGLAGPFQGGGLRMPQFPLRIGDASDTMFKLDVRDDFVTLLREVPGVADAEVVSHLLGEGDAGGESVVRPTGIVYQVRQEVGGGLESDSLLGERRTTQSLQLWCADQPWRLYEEFATCLGARPVRRVAERSWLVAWGEGGR